MSLAEITLILLPSPRKVKLMCSRRPSSALPSACKRGSRSLCFASATTSSGELKNTCSASAVETPCFSFLRAFPSSQSKPVMIARSIMAVYYGNIHKYSRSRHAVPRGGDDPRTLLPAAASLGQLHLAQERL